MAQITETIVAPIWPQIEDGTELFDTRSDALKPQLIAIQNQMNTYATQANALATEVNGYQITASAAAVAAANSASNAAGILSDVQQIQATLDQDVQINDTTASSTGVYSSEKTEQVALDLIDDNSVAVDKTWSAQKLFDETGKGSTLRATASGDITNKDLVSLLADGRLELTQSGGVSDVQFDNILSTSIQICGISKLTDTSYVIVYADNSQTDRNRFVVVDASSGTPVLGTPEAFILGSTVVVIFADVVAVSSTKFIITSSTSDKAYVIDISGATSVTETNLAAFIVTPKLRKLDADKVLMISNVDNTNAYVSILTINPGDTVTEGTRVTVSNSDQNNNDIVVIDSSKFIAVYRAKTSGANTLRARVCDVSGTSISVSGTENQLKPAIVQLGISADIVNGYLCVAYYYSTSTQIEVLTASIDGYVLSAVDNIQAYDVSNSPVNILRATQNKDAVLAWSESSSNGASQAIRIEDDGSILNSGTNIFRATAISGLSLTALSAGKVAAVFLDSGGDVSLDTFTAQVNGGNTADWIGFARSDALDTEEVTASILGGVVDGLTGLEINKRYYIDSATAGLTTVDTGVPVGRATKTTEIMITGGQ